MCILLLLLPLLPPTAAPSRSDMAMAYAQLLPLPLLLQVVTPVMLQQIMPLLLQVHACLLLVVVLQRLLLLVLLLLFQQQLLPHLHE
jgi:hypothetical protein